jgi:hypothetical protein
MGFRRNGPDQQGKFRADVFYQPKKAFGIEAEFEKKNSKPKQRPSVKSQGFSSAIGNWLSCVISRFSFYLYQVHRDDVAGTS